MEKVITVLERKMTCNSRLHHLPNVALNKLFLSAFTFKENSEYKQHKLLFW